MQKILLIEDDVGISTSLKLYLENSDFEVEQCFDGENAISLYKNFSPNLVILDVNLPGKNGFEVCEELRTFSQIPIMMLTAKNTENDTILGFEKGADDYVAKPFSPKELLARVHSLIKRHENILNSKEVKRANVLFFDDIELHLDTAEVTVKKNKISLTKNEYDILETLMRSEGKIVTREELMRDAIGYENYMYDRTLDTHMKNLRKKLGEKNYILTIRGKGYRLSSEI